MKKKKAALGLTVLFLIAGTAPLSAEDPARTARIAGAVYLGDVPTVVAEAQGLFEQQGVHAITTHHDSGKESLARLRAGEADFALAALTPIVLDRLTDNTPGGLDDPVILASLVHSNNLLKIVTNENSDIEKPADFAGKRIAITRGTKTEFVWWLYHRYHAIDPTSVALIDLPAPDMPDALADGQADAALTWEPWFRSTESSTRHIHLRELYTGKWVLVTTRQTARENAALCREVLRAYKHAIDFINTNPEHALTLYRDQFEILGEIDHVFFNAFDFDINLDWSLIASLQEQLDWSGHAGYSTAAGPVHVLELIESGPLREAWPSAVGLPQPSSREPAR